MKEKILIAGAGGFIGGHLAARLLEEGNTEVRCVDRKPVSQWGRRHEGAENRVLDLRRADDCREAVQGVTRICHLAADAGGEAYLAEHGTARMRDVLITSHLLEAARRAGTVEHVFLASSASVYPVDAGDVFGLGEEAAYPALPGTADGWEKLFSERMVRQFGETFGWQVSVARLHAVYGPGSAWGDEREDLVAAVCRQVAEAVVTGRDEIEIPGDGEVARSFTYVDDCVEGIMRILGSTVPEPVNLGSAEVVTVSRLVELVEEIAGRRLERRHRLEPFRGPRVLGSDNTLIRSYLGWEPPMSLSDGLGATYRWIFDQVSRRREPVRPRKRLSALLGAAAAS